MYNAITRNVEPELFPCLRRFGLAFYAYNATAGGFLSGKHRDLAAPPSDGRFATDMYRQRYWRESYFQALDVVRAACDAAGIGMAAAAHRWLAHHSMLDAARGDAILVGASKQAHLVDNLAACQGEPLPKAVLEAIDAACEVARPQSVKVRRATAAVLCLLTVCCLCVLCVAVLSTIVA